MTDQKPALLMVAHGSRRQAANEEFFEHVNQTAKQVSHLYQTVEGAFLELASPTINDGLSALAEQGHSTIYLLPCFLNRGRHVAEDIPEDVDAYRKSNPHVEIICLPYIGSTAAYLQMLAQLASDQATKP